MTTKEALTKAQTKFTKAKAAVDGTPKAEAAYQKAKKDLALARQADAVTRQPNVLGNGDANAQTKAVAVKAGAKKRRSN